MRRRARCCAVAPNASMSWFSPGRFRSERSPVCPNSMSDRQLPLDSFITELWVCMHTAPDTLFKTLADPTRRAILERLTRDGEQTVRVLTDQAGVSQPAVSKHLGVLKLAGLVQI